jgi:hypothetical protein
MRPRSTARAAPGIRIPPAVAGVGRGRMNKAYKNQYIMIPTPPLPTPSGGYPVLYKQLDPEKVWEMYYKEGNPIRVIAGYHGVEKKIITRIIKLRMKSSDVDFSLQLLKLLQATLKENGFITFIKASKHMLYFRGLPVKMGVCINNKGRIEVSYLKSIDKWHRPFYKFYEYEPDCEINDPNYDPKVQLNKIVKMAKNLRELEEIWDDKV